jgi:hypothetical protein
MNPPHIMPHNSIHIYVYPNSIMCLWLWILWSQIPTYHICCLKASPFICSIAPTCLNIQIITVLKTRLCHSSTSILFVSFYLHMLSLVITLVVYIWEKAPQCLQAYTGHMDQDNAYGIHEITEVQKHISLFSLSCMDFKSLKRDLHMSSYCQLVNSLYIN